MAPGLNRKSNQELKRNGHIIVPLTVRPTSKYDAGGTPTQKDVVYIFNVCIYKDPADKDDHICRESKPDALLLEKLHGNQIKKLYVQII